MWRGWWWEGAPWTWWWANRSGHLLPYLCVCHTIPDTHPPVQNNLPATSSGILSVCHPHSSLSFLSSPTCTMIHLVMNFKSVSVSLPVCPFGCLSLHLLACGEKRRPSNSSDISSNNVAITYPSHAHKQRSLATLTRTAGVGQHYAAIICPELSSAHGRPADERRWD